MWDLSSPTRDQTCVPCIGRQILYHWTTREVPITEYWVEIPVLYSRSLLIIYFIYSSVYMLMVQGCGLLLNCSFWMKCLSPLFCSAQRFLPWTHTLPQPGGWSSIFQTLCCPEHSSTTHPSHLLYYWSTWPSLPGLWASWEQVVSYLSLQLEANNKW